MRTESEIRNWLIKNPINTDEVSSITTWLMTGDINLQDFIFSHSPNGKTLIDVIEFVNSESKPIDLTGVISQFEKVEKEVLKLRKLINKIK